MQQKYFIDPFGVAGDITPTVPDATDPSGFVSYSTGWTFDYQRDLTTDPAAKSITRVSMNSVFNDITTVLQDYQQTGNPEFITAANNGGSAFSYRIGAIVRYSSGGTAPFATFFNIQDNNTNTPGGTGWINLDIILTTGNKGRLLGVQVFTATGTYTPTAGISSVIFEVQGGGGAGAGAGSATGGNVSLGGPGSSGAYAKGVFTSGTIGSSQAVTIGAGGTGVSGAAGNNGGTSSVGSLITAPGGTGGGTLTNQVPPTVTANGVASSAPSGGNIFSSNGAASSPTITLSSSAAVTGAGGASVFGNGAISVSVNTTGPNATAPGSGGGGTAVNASGGTITGGAGFRGIVIAWEFS